MKNVKPYWYSNLEPLGWDRDYNSPTMEVDGVCNIMFMMCLKSAESEINCLFTYFFYFSFFWESATGFYRLKATPNKISCKILIFS